MSAEFVPEPFRLLHDFLSATATIDLLRRAVYGVGPAEWEGWILLGCYAALGIALSLVGKPYFLAKTRRRRAAKYTPMMTSAQIASLVDGGYVTAVVGGPGEHRTDPPPTRADPDDRGARPLDQVSSSHAAPATPSDRMQSRGPDTHRRPRHGAHVAHEDRAATTSSEEADGDAVAAETGALG